MTPKDRAGAWLERFGVELRADLVAATEQVDALLTHLPGNAALENGDPLLAFTSVCIDRAYTALEAAFVRVARRVDAAMPIGADWRTTLLHQMALPIQDARPAILSGTTLPALHRMRRHRH